VVYPDMGEDKYNPTAPHVTIVMFTDVRNPNLGFTKEDVIDAIQETMHSVMLKLRVEGVEWFGPDQNVPVLRVHHDYLHVYRESIKGALAARGIEIDETYPEYKPHVTITDEAALDGVYPRTLMTAPVELWWADVHYKIEDL
jgi:2'-5' RNA ligase